MLRPTTTLRPAPHKTLIEQAQGAFQRERMERAERRRLVLEGDWRPLVWAMLWQYGYGDKMRDALARRVKRSPNVALKFLRKVALAYRVPPTRTIAGANETTDKAFRRLMLKGSGLLTEAPRWERLVWGLNVVITVPVVRPAPGQPFGRALSYELLLPSNTEVVLPDDNPHSKPVASVTAFNAGEAFGASEQTVWTILDDEAWTTYDSKGRQLQRAPHNAGIWPGTEWRRLRGADWWASDIGEGLFDATVEAAHLAARLDNIRQGQDHFRELLFSEDIAQIPQQVSGSDGPMEVPLGPEDAKYVVENAIVPIDQHRDHITFHAREGAETMGVDADLIDFAAGADSIEPMVAAQKHDDLMALRRDTTTHFAESERDSAWKTALVLQGARHPLASLLQPSKIYDGFEANWSDLDFVDQPSERVRVLESEIDLGLKSTIDAYMALHPGVSREEAKKAVRRIDEEEAERAEFLAERNIPRRVRDRLSDVPELQGRIGGMVAGTSRSNDDDGHSERSTAPAANSERSAGTSPVASRNGARRRR